MRELILAPINEFRERRFAAHLFIGRISEIDGALPDEFVRHVLEKSVRNKTALKKIHDLLERENEIN